MPDQIDLSGRVVPGAYFLRHPAAPRRTPFGPDPAAGATPYRHCFTYAGGGSTIRAELLDLIDGARTKVFVAAPYLGDPGVLDALGRAADRLRGGVYVVAALDKKGLDQALDADGLTDKEKQRQFRVLLELPRSGIWVRGFPGLHAKFVVVDDRVALVSSANLVTRSFDQVGENGVVVTGSDEVRPLARFFARMWQRSPYDLPPDRHDTSVGDNTDIRSTITPPAPPSDGPGPIWTWPDSEHHIAETLVRTCDGAEHHLVLSTWSIANMTHGLRAGTERPKLLFEPVRQAIERGVRVRMLMRGRNAVRSSREEAAAFADIGVEIVLDRLTHAKAVIADGARGALFSANFATDHGLIGGIEMGVRLDNTSALTEAARYFDHVMSEADLRFVRDPTLGILAASLYANSFTPWSGPDAAEVRCDDADWQHLATQPGAVLWERPAGRPLTLYCGPDSWTATTAGDRMTLTPGRRGDEPAGDRLTRWLESRSRAAESASHGLCPATLVRVS